MILWLGLLALVPLFCILNRIRQMIRLGRSLSLCLLGAGGAAGGLGVGAEAWQQPAMTPPPILQVMADDLNIRACPDTACDRIGRLRAGETVTVTGTHGLWVALGDVDGPAWVHSGYLGPAPTPAGIP